ncbi:cytosolic sulfotransferase 3-like isoform X2 [Micropterus salmoides]|uniref:cytosolic sulfotransferase 3-like isoform X2 n=1 Tax=Micropterus salmoides TaxID=27706 RepID=UPI0018EC4F6C|nr:cytosolic sulfotransferase 3-like isoform X2 [Micropterus salmoides]
MELPPRPTLFDFHGVSMVKYFTDNWDSVQNFKARPDDILIATYPKAGTTWVSYILDLLYFGQTSPERQASIPIHERVPFLEISTPSRPSGKDLADQLPTTPRLIKTHLPVQFVPKSFWEQNSRVKPLVCEILVFGSWYDHVNGWWEKKQTYSNVHYMFYEDLIEDCGREIDRLCSFLGLSPSAEETERVTNGVTFDNMKANKMTNYSTSQVMNQKVSPFMRKGKVGDWKNHFTVAQDEQFEEDYKQKMKNPTLKFRTEV